MNSPQTPCLTTFLVSTALPLSKIETAQDVASWQALAHRQFHRWPTPAERAVAGGFCSLNLGTAFTFGYQSALQAIAPDVVDYNAASFCVTESGGNKPSAIATALRSTPEGWSLTGQKSFVSGAEHARRLLVAASIGQDDKGRNKLTMAVVDTDQPGVKITALPPLPFAPDISHGSVEFDNVAITAQQILPGDGYSDYVKPFRTVEDIHVCCAVLGYCVRIARSIPVPSALLEELLALVQLHRSLAQQPADAASTHLALAGARLLLEPVLLRLETALADIDPAQCQLWRRDKALLNVAAKARAQRTIKAWEMLAGTQA